MTIDVLRVPRWSRRRFWQGRTSIFRRSRHFGGEVCGEGGRILGYGLIVRREIFALWVRFFRHARLHSVNALIGDTGCMRGAELEQYGAVHRNARNCGARVPEKSHPQAQNLLRTIIRIQYPPAFSTNFAAKMSTPPEYCLFAPARNRLRDHRGTGSTSIVIPVALISSACP